MVDVWFLFCIGITFLVIICHAITDNIIYPGPEKRSAKKTGIYDNSSSKKLKLGTSSDAVWAAKTLKLKDLSTLSLRTNAS
ncbi:hypothetical protein SK128_021287, partial [Halocaridina rubra]